MASAVVKAQVKCAESFSEVQKIFAKEDNVVFKDAADNDNWEQVLTAVKICGYGDNEFRYFLADIRQYGSENLLSLPNNKVTSRMLAQFTYFLYTLRDLGILAQPPVSYLNKEIRYVCTAQLPED